MIIFPLPPVLQNWLDVWLAEWQVRPREKIRGFSVFIHFKKDGSIMAITEDPAPGILIGGGLAFGLNGVVQAGVTFVEPTVDVDPSSTASGTIVLNPSFTAPTDGSSPVSPVPAGYVGNFTTAGTFTSDGKTTGQVVLDADVLGVQDAGCEFTVSPLPGVETVAFDTSKFVVIAPPAS